MNMLATSFFRKVDELPILDVLGLEVRVLAGGDETDAQSCITRMSCPQGVGAPLHRHPHAENFFVMEGTLSVQLGEETIALGPGEFFHVHADAPHGFRNEAAEPAVFINCATPAGHEAFFRDMDAMSKRGHYDLSEVAAVCAKHQIELLV
ncbi:cupin domain-containing protein [Pelagicoccus sp. SDUM812005]|uniref:cupin domain-containing protein n=1 Tax=Pelagicoccus sp. SDUM812005 TaxID=3041257 RepID=UPI00280E4602|nr:cupin domain-containing protein [Pelagicoccus sp. SDUM812005]MDQ8182646.1 cupin domain-containing protein [Pelagicoccus sp. SDUM812005]